MARNGSGEFSLLGVLAPPGQTSNSTNINAIMDDIADALTDSINKAGTQPFAANQPMGGFKLTNLAAGSSANDSVRLSQVQSDVVSHATTVGGTVDAITAAFTPTIAAYTANMRIRWTSGGANTITNPTINVDGLGAKTIKKGAGSALAVGELGASGTILEAVYNGTDFILLNPAATASAGLGQQTIFVPALGMYPRTTNGAAYGSVETTTHKVMLRTLDFDASTIEYAQFAIQMPKGWDEGTLIAQFVWSHPSTTTNFDAIFGIQAVAFANDDAADTAFGTAVTVTDTGGTTNDIYLTAETSAFTVAGSPGAEEYVVFQVYRNATSGSDNLAVDARLHGVKIHYTTAALTDD